MSKQLFFDPAKTREMCRKFLGEDTADVLVVSTLRCRSEIHERIVSSGKPVPNIIELKRLHEEVKKYDNLHR